MPPALFALAIFQIGSHFYNQAGLDLDSLIYASCVTGMAGAHYYIQILLLEMGSCELFAWVGFEHRSSLSLLPK
jgi:hypothetical protein